MSWDNVTVKYTGGNVGNYLKKCREESNISQAKLAKIIGISRGTIIHTENNRLLFQSISTLFRYCDFFDIDIMYLLELYRKDMQYIEAHKTDKEDKENGSSDK